MKLRWNALEWLPKTKSCNGQNIQKMSRFRGVQVSILWKTGFAQGRTRTDDLRITNALLYQLSYLGKADHFTS